MFQKEYPVFSEILNITCTLADENVERPSAKLRCYWSEHEYAGITFCDVERSFPPLEWILTHQRQQLNVANEKELLIPVRIIQHHCKQCLN